MQPEWIMAGEIVETSQLFARTVAGIDPAWIVDLGAHLCKVVHNNPHWSASAGRVLVEEVTTLYGFEVRRRNVAYGLINPAEATALFIRSALVEENLYPEPPQARREQDMARASASQLLAIAAPDPPSTRQQYAFLEHNRKARERIETWQTRARRHDLPNLDDALFRFYAARIENVSSLHELNRFLRGLPGQDALCVTDQDLVDDQALDFDTAAFPDSVELGGQPVPLEYAYRPGEEHDGITLKLNPALAQTVPVAHVEWAVPGLREQQAAELLRALPKALRRDLMPLAPKAADIAGKLVPSQGALAADLSRFVLREYGVQVPVSAWNLDQLPRHLRPRIAIVGHDQKTLQAGRDLDALRKQLENAKVPATVAGDPPEWRRCLSQWERFGLTSWSFGDLPERITVRENAQHPLYAWAGLQVEEQHVNVKLFRSREHARRASLPAVHRLIELALQKDLAWLQKDLRSLAKFAPLLAGWCSLEELQADAYGNLKRQLFPGEMFAPLTRAAFDAATAAARSRLPGLAHELITLLEPVLQLRAELMRRAAQARPVPQPKVLSDLRQLGRAPAGPEGPLAGIANEVAALMPGHFLRNFPFRRLAHLPRYLKGLLLREERARLNPLKDAERARLVAPWSAALRELQSKAPGPAVDEFRWMIEEYKVSVFAQELGTAFPVSPKRLEEFLARLRVIP